MEAALSLVEEESSTGFDALFVAIIELDASEPWQVAVVLTECKARGRSWESAWYNALRAIMPPRTCSPELKREIADARWLLHETKPWLRAAYEDRAPTLAELERATTLTERRLKRAFA